MPQLTLYPEVSPKQSGKLAGKRKPEPGSSFRLSSRALECFEDHPLLLGSDSLAVIDDIETQHVIGHP